MGSPVQHELNILSHYASGRSRLIETGGGLSTEYIYNTSKHGGKLISIDIDPETQTVPGVHYLTGWSIQYENIIKEGDPQFYYSRYESPDEQIACGNAKLMKGETGLLQKAIDLHEKQVDFFFCDTGEYCGIAEWNIIKNSIAPSGIVILHDIYYPKSIKCFQIVKEIENATHAWEILKKTKSRQGMLVAQKKS